jgi:hypothetical protein
MYSGIYGWYSPTSGVSEKVYVDRGSADGFGISRALVEKKPVVYVTKSNIEKDRLPQVTVKLFEES